MTNTSTSTTTTAPATESIGRKGDKPDLFQQVYYFINDSLSPSIRTQLDQLLSERDAINVSTPTSLLRFDISKITHFITDSIDFPEYWLLRPKGPQQERERSLEGQVKGRDPALDKDKLVEIVSPVWVTRSFDLQILQQPRYYSADRTLYFSGLCFCTSELPETDALAIQAGVQSLGGQWRKELTREVTHLFCVAPVGKKYEAAIKHGQELGMVVVLPHWFEECLKLHQPLPLDAYLFPEPPILSLSVYLTSGGPSSSTVPSKSYEERLSDFYKSKLRTSGGTSSSSRSTSPTVTISATQKILGIAPGGNVFFPRGGLSAATVSGNVGNGVGGSAVGNAAGGGGGGGGGGELESYQKTSTSLITTLPSTTTTTGSQPANPPSPTLATCSLPIFAERKVYLSGELGLRPGLEMAIKQRVQDAGGTCWSFGVDGEEFVSGKKAKGKSGDRERERRKVAEEKLRECNLVVCRNREGWEYWQAFDQKKTIGNLAWLYHVLQTNRLSSPLDRLLHYPLPAGPIPKFNGVSITISNYSGLARDYVRTLIESVGAKFEGAMSKFTGYVISASDFGAKVKHAKQWSIPLVTHLWLEACILDWSLVPPVASSHYLCTTNPGVNFTTILGATPLPRGSIERWAGRSDVDALKKEALKLVFEDIAMEDSLGVGGGAEVEMEVEGGEKRFEDVDVEMEEQQDEEEEEVQVVKNAGKKGKGKGKEKEVLPQKKKRGRVETEEEEEEEEEEEPAMEVDEDEDEEEEEEEEEIQLVSTKKGSTKVKKPVKSIAISTSPAKASTSTSKSKPLPATTNKRKEREPSSSPVPTPPPPPQQKILSMPEPAQPQQQTGYRSDSTLTTARSEEEDEKSEDEDEEEEEEKSDDDDEESEEDTKKKGKQLVGPKSKQPPSKSSAVVNKKKRKPSPSPSPSRSPSPAPLATPSKLIDWNNSVPVVGKRAAAGLAAKRLAEQMPDANKFAQELRNSTGKKRKRDSFGYNHVASGRSGGGGRGRTQTVEIDSGSEEEKKNDESDEEEEREKEKKKRKGKEKEKVGPVSGKGKKAAAAMGDSEAEDDEEEEERPVVSVRGARKGAVASKNATAAIAKTAVSKRFPNVAAAQDDAAQGISSFDNPPHPAPKKPATKAKPTRILTTGLGWDKNSEEMKSMAKLGAKWTEKPSEVTHLISGGISRTEKFLSCLAYAPKIVNKRWVEKSIAAGRLLDEDDFLLEDKVKERELGDSLVNILKRASQKPLFEGITVYLTPKILPDVATLRKVVQCGGGTVSTASIDEKIPMERIINAAPGTAYVVSCAKDRQKWEKLVAIDRTRIYSVEAIFQSVMYQNMKFLDEYRIDPRTGE